jgi:hypothetical protein
LIGLRNELFLREGLDHPNQLEFVRQISVYAKSNLGPAGSRRLAIAARNLPDGQIKAARHLVPEHERPKPHPYAEHYPYLEQSVAVAVEPAGRQQMLPAISGDSAMELILIIVLVLFLFGGGGYWGRRRGHW